MGILFCIIFLVILGVIWALFADSIALVSPKIYALFASISFIICIIIASNSYDNLGTVITLAILSLFLFGFCWLSSERRKQIKDERVKEHLAQMIEEDRTKEHDKYEIEVNSLSRRYGTISNQYELSQEINIKNRIFVFADSKKIWIKGSVYDFKDIIGCTINDDSYIKKANVTYKTSTSTGSMIGRAVVGGMLTGGFGAVIGGATASKTTVAEPSGSDAVIHNFTIVLNINSFTSPVIYINCGDNIKLKDELLGMINVILSHNSQNV